MGPGSEAPLAVGTEAAARRRIAAYYDATQVLYSTVWSRRSLHYGLSENGTKRQADAVRNMDRFVAARLDLPPGGRVLDAGCGVGGTSAFLAEECGLDVVGITLSQGQLRRAQRLAARSRAAIRPTFHVGDYLSTGYPAASFDGVVSIESACYAEDKRDFMTEAFRILRPGGRLVVADGFLARPMTGRAAAHYRRLLDGMVLPNLAQVDAFWDGLGATGFVGVRCDDKCVAVQRSSRRIFLLSLMGVIGFALPCRLRILPRAWLRHAWAGVAQGPLFRDGTLAYCVFSARKPGG